MPVVKQVKDGPQVLNAHPFSSESELENILANQPSLMIDDGESPVALVKPQVPIQGAGKVDLFLVDADGLPMVVEVKLARNSESRRQVVGQIFDYVSALVSMTVDELDDTTAEALQRAIGSFSDDEDESVTEKRWKMCAANLRTGKARVVVAIDEAPDDLVRILRFLNEHSDLDVRLVEIKQYPDQESGEVIFVPNLVVHSEEVLSPIRRSTSRLRPEFRSVLDRYKGIRPQGFKLKGSARRYRKIVAPDWPAEPDMHYEFRDRDSRMSVEIHFEPKGHWPEQIIESVRSSLRLLEPKLVEVFSSAKVEWRPDWHKGGRLAVVFEPETPASEVAKAMVKLIECTKDPLAHTLQSLTVA